ncbi:MAG: hypothetical protein WC911_04880 [Thermoleophilia bacterium]
MPTNCPGSDVTITTINCPKCGEEVELFTGDSKAKCPGCGISVRREVASCIEWCPGASECFRHVFEEDRAREEKEASED